MPEALKRFLSMLNDKNADEVWSYLVRDEFAVDDLIELIRDSHPELTERILGR